MARQRRELAALAEMRQEDEDAKQARLELERTQTELTVARAELRLGVRAQRRRVGSLAHTLSVSVCRGVVSPGRAPNN